MYCTFTIFFFYASGHFQKLSLFFSSFGIVCGRLSVLHIHVKEAHLSVLAFIKVSCSNSDKSYTKSLREDSVFTKDKLSHKSCSCFI